MKFFFKIYFKTHLKKWYMYLNYLYIPLLGTGVVVAFGMGLASIGNDTDFTSMPYVYQIIKTGVGVLIWLFIIIILVLFPVLKINKQAAKQYCSLNNKNNIILIKFLYNLISFILNIFLSFSLFFIVINIFSLLDPRT